MRRLGVAALIGAGLLAAACGSNAGGGSRPTARVSASAATAAGGPCASVRTTTPIADVPLACAELWAPYQVTEVPPPDILQQEHVPAAPPVVNRTNGAVSDAEAQRWADASNRDSGWYKWAYENDQPALLSRLVGPALINRQQDASLAAGAHIDVPDCDLYPVSNTLYPMDTIGRAYFTRKQLPTNDSYLFVVVYRGPCTLTFHYPDGQTTQDGPFFTSPETVFAPGAPIHDSVLGDLWFGDAGGSCDDAIGPPSTWCGR